MRRALAAAGATIAACGALAGAAQADTLYPKAPQGNEAEARTFTNGAGGWVDVSRECSLLGAIPLPIPLLCSSVNEHAPGVGNPPGSLRSNFQSVANLGGLLFEGTATWRSPQFTVTEASEDALTGATLSFERRAQIQALIDQGGEAVTQVVLVRTAPSPSRTTLLTETLTAQNSQFGQARAILVEPPAIEAGSTYALEFNTTFTTTAIQLAQGQISAFYDNVQLRAHDGTDTLNTPPTVTTLLATDVTGTTATFNAVVSPKGLPTEARFQVREQGAEEWRDVPYGNVGDGTNAVRISLPGVGGLEPCKSYEYRALASNSQGNGEGQPSSFQTSCRPAAKTLPAAPISATAAGLNASVTPNGPETRYRYQISVFNDFREAATLTTEERSAGTGFDTKQPLNEPLSGLRPQTTYYYRVIARNEFGETVGDTVTFATPQQSAPGPPGTPGAPGAPGPRGPSGVNRQDSTLRNNDPRALLRIRQSRVSVGLRGRRRGQIRVRVFCRSANGRSCAGTVKLRTRARINPSIHGRRVAKRRVTFATFEYQLARGKSGVAIGQMTPEKVELLRLRRGLRRTIGVTISVQTTDSQGNTQTIVQNGRLRLVSSPR